jgi:hypothetical protein
VSIADNFNGQKNETIDVVVVEKPPENKGPPVFKEELKEIILNPNEIMSYTLPEIEDPDNNKFIIKSISLG